ncbi:PLD nuclease N-terminal domain-containing protein [Rhodococcus sp. UNC363MFTsu5.1]|uniref:PLD nuclease N-terminal domain-containing protein n=1 Tax=Rhodococcus sp. UNC363MFTsu5.1 TaxID=1449069 RepID=UPI000482E6A5|nr:PLD nuclease N-terminal domain-containing protein [Rhodococcus sp. UNC363MFTsu5.1]
MPYAAFGLVMLALWVFCIVDVLTCEDHQVRHLPRIGWILIVLLIPTVGSLLWLILGRPQSGARQQSGRPYASAYAEYDRPGRQLPQNPDDDEAFLRQCRERAEEQRRIAKQQQIERESRQRDLD